MKKTEVTRRNFLKSSSAVAALSAIAAVSGCMSGVSANVRKKNKQNILFIMTDQQRRDTIRCYGNDKVQTPALDSLARSGARLTSCYTTQPVCTPCRSSIITGKFPTAIDTWENKRPLKDHSTSWLRILGEAGYKTCYIGKWHLGDGDKGPDYIDDWHGYETGWPHWMKDPKTNAKRYRPDEESDYAINFMKKHKDVPFACFVSYYPPHTKKIAPEENMKLYDGVFKNRGQHMYHAMVNRIDWNVGRMLKFLDESGLADNTIVVFTSDHGENYPHRWNKHHKRLCYDQSANVPLIVRAPGVTKPGTVLTQPVSSADLCPTILDLLGFGVPGEIHGLSMRPLLSGNVKGWREDVFIQNRPIKFKDEMMERCIVTDRWKLILNQKRPPELYDRRAKVKDSDNLYGKVDQEIVDDLFERLSRWGKFVSDSLVDELLTKYKSV